MTYIIGYAQKNVTAIFADCRITYQEPGGQSAGANTGLKNGILFPGCIFGSCGSAEESRRFLTSFKEQSEDNVASDVDRMWDAFRIYHASYDFCNVGERFQIVLSVKHSADLRLHLIDSASPVIQELDSPGCHTFGSGIRVLDDYVHHQVMPTLEGMSAEVLKLTNDLIRMAKEGVGQSNMQGVVLSEYFRELVQCYCLATLLNIKALAFERSILEDRGVGGAFHFVYQTQIGESAQEPLLLILHSSTGESTGQPIVTVWIFRISYCEGALFVEKWAPPERNGPHLVNTNECEIFMDSRSSGLINRMGVSEREELRDRLIEQHKRESGNDFYRIAAVEATNPLSRRSLVLAVGFNIRKTDILQKDGTVGGGFREAIDAQVLGMI